MRRICKSGFARTGLIAVLLLGMTNIPLAQTRGTEAIAEITFEPGKKSAVVSGSVQLPHGVNDMHNDGADRYSFRYRAGQRLTFNLESEGKRALFTITRADEDWPNLPVSKTMWTGRLPKSGTYYITVWTREGTTNYRLKVSLR